MLAFLIPRAVPFANEARLEYVQFLWHVAVAMNVRWNIWMSRYDGPHAIFAQVHVAEAPQALGVVAPHEFQSCMV